ncbi:MAG TPA: SprT family zinc-dependent metalloprotease [Candidatus Paceibacterota bacterium]|jgi:hypothetical protein
MYTIRESTRAKYLRVTVYLDGAVVLTKPLRVSEKKALKFLEQQRVWITEVQAKLERRQSGNPPVMELPRLHHGTKAHKEAVERARALVLERLPIVNQRYGFAYGRVAIKSQKTMWGSCSHKGNLNFNYKIVFLPRPIADYLIVHELCHLIEHNHSPQFWALVERSLPEYKTLRRQLRSISLSAG